MSDTKAIERYLDWRDERENVVHDVSPHKFACDEAVQRVLEAAACWYETAPGDGNAERLLDDLAAATADYLELIESDE